MFQLDGPEAETLDIEENDMYAHYLMYGYAAKDNWHLNALK